MAFTFTDGALLIDTSHWRPKLSTKKMTGLDGIIGRLGTQWSGLPPYQWMDQTVVDHCQVAYDIMNQDGSLGVAYGAFWYDDWCYWLMEQWDLDKVRDLTPDTDPRIVATRRALFAGGTYLRQFQFIGIDVEQQPYESMSQTDNYANWISTSARSYVDCLLYMMAHGEIPVMPIFMYSRASYIKEWATLKDGTCPLTDWMSTYQKNLGPTRFFAWVAHWGYSRAVNSIIYTPITTKAQTLPPDGSKPATFSDWPNIIWQYGGDIGPQCHMDGVTDERNIPLVTDVNITRIPKADFYRLIKFAPRNAPVNPPDPPQPPAVILEDQVCVRFISNETNIRTEPSTARGTASAVGKLVKGMGAFRWLETRTVPTVYGTVTLQDVWYRIDGSPAAGTPASGECWVAGNVGGKQYSELFTQQIKKEV